jgi:hypothetical protein
MEETATVDDRIFLTCFDNEISRSACNLSGEWTVAQLAGEHKVTCLAADPADRRLVYAGTPNGVLRSDDCGLTWRPSGMEGHIVKALAVSPHDSNVLYAGTKPALMFNSRDGGQTWTELDGFRRIPNRWWWFSPAEPPDLRAYVRAMGPSPNERNGRWAGGGPERGRQS